MYTDDAELLLPQVPIVHGRERHPWRWRQYSPSR
jgi:hypothetical protein